MFRSILFKSHIIFLFIKTNNTKLEYYVWYSYTEKTDLRFKILARKNLALATDQKSNFELLK